MANNQQTYSITYSNPQSITVEDYLNNENTVVYIYHGKANQFLNIVGYDGLTNRQRIEQSYKTADEKRYIGAAYNKLLIKSGTILYIEYDKVNSPNFVTEGIEIVSNNDVAFKSAAICKLEADLGYVQAFGNGVKESYPDATVTIWCRALSDKMNEKELKGQFLDLSPFIQKIETNVGKNGGNFSITLPPIICELDETNDKWILKEDTVTFYKNANGAGLQNFGYVSEGNLLDQNGNRNQFLFNNIIKQKDLIFIRLETLEMEKEQRIRDKMDSLNVSKISIANRIYDMIGLVDSTTISINPSNNDVNINVIGRDLSSLFIDDGTYAYALESSQGILRIAGGTRARNSLIERIYADGGLLFLKLFMQNPISYLLQFIIQQLSNLKVIPNDLLSSYSERRNYKIDIINKNEIENKNYKPQYKKELAPGIFQIVKLVIDDSVKGRTLCDSSMSTANGSLMIFLRTVCQEPLVEIIFDTIGDEYILTVRQPPYTQKAIISLIEGKVNTETGVVEVPPAIVTIKAEDLLSEKLYMEETAFSWFHFFPKNALINSKVDYSLSILPAVYFEEYAQIFGSRPFQQSHPYIAFNPKADSKNASWDKQVYYDLKYVIESNQYLPFSRNGTLVINLDRRIKVSNIIRYQPTGEIFFVNSVRHNVEINNNSVNSYTILEVSRGLVEQVIYGVDYADEDGVTRSVSYFNIIDTTLTLNNITTTRTETTTELLNNNTSGEKIYPGFGEYMQYQQGTGGAHIIAKGYLNNTPANRFDKRILKNMKSNIGGDFTEELNPVSFIKYWVKRYNSAYITANNIKPFTTYEDLYQTVCKEENVPVDVIKTFGEIEHGDGDNVGSHKGLMQVSDDLAKAYGKSNTDPKDSIVMACQEYKKCHKDNPFLFLYQDSNGEIQQSQTKDVTKTYKETGLDYDAVFSKFKVNVFSFQFFLKNLQFDPAYRTVKSRHIKNPDGSLPEVIVTRKSKKK